MKNRVVRIISVFLFLMGFSGTMLSAQTQDPSQTPQCKKISAPYKKAKAAYEAKARKYWGLIEKKKKVRRSKRRNKQAISNKDYVLHYPPVYKGPKKPKCLIKKRTGKRISRVIGTVPQYLKAAWKHYKFKPKHVSEREFKTSYAKHALSVGLTAEQVVGVYALETGGLGPYSRQSGVFNVNRKCQRIKPKGRPISTALGYAQLLAANTSAVLTEQGETFAKNLEFKAVLNQGKRKKELLGKAALIRKMRKDIKIGIRNYKRRNNWREFVAFGKTRKGFAVHTLNLDADIGPMLQVYKLKKIVDVAKRKGHRTVSAAQLELMNLVGYGRGLEMMRPEAKGAPTPNFFSRGGYERNPVAKKTTAAGLLKILGERIAIHKKKCGSVEFLDVFNTVGKK